MIAPGLRRIGFTGHQTLSPDTRTAVRAELRDALSVAGEVLGYTSLAAGSDQIFAECVLESGNRLAVVTPCEHYEDSFAELADLARYQLLLAQAADRLTLPYQSPGEAAYWAAGQEIVHRADELIAVWDGQPAGGLGGTADVVAYAVEHQIQVRRIWPPGARRR